MAERMLALRTRERVRERADALDAGGLAPSRLDRASRDILLRFVRGELPPVPHVLAAAQRGLANPALVARLVEAHRAGAPLGRNVDKRIVDPLAVLADPAFDLTAAGRAEQTQALTTVAQQLDIAMKSCREGHERLAAIRHDQPVVGWTSECAESLAEVAVAGAQVVSGNKRDAHSDWSVALPPLTMWRSVESGISAALDALLANAPGVARQLLIGATQDFARCHRRFMEYKARTERGASGVAITLKIVQQTCESLVADLAAAELAPAGLLAAALAAAVAGGGAVLIDGAATQGVEHFIGTRKNYELGRLLGDAGQAAVANFISALGSGLLAKPFEKVLGNVLKYHVPPEAWLHLMGDAEKLTAEHAIAHFSRWKYFLELCGAGAATLVSGTVDGLIGRWRARRRKDADVPTVMDALEQDLLTNGLAQLVVSALLRHHVAKAA